MIKLSKYFTFFVVAIFIFGCYLYYSNTALSNKVNDLSLILKNQYSLSDQSLIEATKRLLIEKESFSDQLNRQSDFFIFYVTTLFIILSLFGVTVFYKLLDKKIKDAENTIRKDYKRQQEDYTIHISELKSLKIDSYRDSAILNDLIAYFHRTNGLMGLYLRTMITAIEKAKAVYAIQQTKEDLDRIVYYFDDIWRSLNRYYEHNSNNIIDREDSLVPFQRTILDLSNMDEENIKSIGGLINRQLSGIIRKNTIWLENLDRRPIDTQNQE